MILQPDSSKPIYIQIAEWLETLILQNEFKEHEQVYSQYKLAEMFTINPATAAKGLNVLADEGILYDRRGIGKFVAERAKEKIKEKRKTELSNHLVKKLVREAKYLHVTEKELIDIVQKTYQEMKGEEK
ncbi:MAG TPA: GntR family transcriptional regulator [Bacillota bacterium]|nr:GntR family transcriptional regulator [Bacillota bacterium]